VFKDKVDGIILSNFKPSDELVNVARIVMALHVSLAYPLVIWPCRNVLDQLIFGKTAKGRILGKQL
jgi:hypothetical protein